MSSDVGSNPQTSAPVESKSARKKKAKAEAAASATQIQEKTPSEDVSASSELPNKSNGLEGSAENTYVKELQKTIRNVTKKLNSMQKVDTVIAENPNVSLDDLVASRKINADQKAQALKKPALQAQLVQLEEQVTQYKKFDQEYQQKITQEKEALQRTHSDELEKLRDSLKAEAVIEARRAVKEKFLTFSRFLRAAAARRQQEDEQENELTKAFEGVLLQVYGGDVAAVLAAEKLIDGSDESVPSTEGEPLSVTYAQIKQAALEASPFAAEEAWLDDVAQSQEPPPGYEATVTGTDPTVAHAGLTELNTGVLAVNGNQDSADTLSAPPVSSIGGDAANAAAEAQWDKEAGGSDDPLTESYEIIPKDPAETETPAVAAPNNSIQSWADDTPEVASTSTPVSATTNGNDGFHEVHHSRGGRGRGGFQGEGRGGFRGRGGPRGDGRGGRGRGRGDFRGRGRGGFRGERGGPRGDAQ